MKGQKKGYNPSKQINSDKYHEKNWEVNFSYCPTYAPHKYLT